MTAAPLRVLQVLTDDDRRGAQTFGYELGERMRELANVEVRTVALAPGAAGGLDVETLGPSRRSGRTLRALRTAMATVDVTAAHGSTTLVACGLAGIGPGRPFVYRQISDPEYWTPTVRKRLRTRAFYRLPAQVVALSPTTESVLRRRFGLSANRLTVIPNAVDERRCPPASPQTRVAARVRLGLPSQPAKVIAFVGALVPEKGVGDLIAAAPAAATVVIAGQGHAQDSLEVQATKAAIDCRFLGSVEDPWDVYAAADLFVLPSRGGDTQPAVLIEAALVGTPVITTDVGAITDIVLHDETGVVLRPGDPAALRVTIDTMLEHGDELARLSTAARSFAEAHFSLSAVAGRWLDVLSRVSVHVPDDQ